MKGTLEDYKKLLNFIENSEIMTENYREIVYDDFPPENDEEIQSMTYELNGEKFKLWKNWENEIVRSDEDKPQYWYWQFDPSDEYVIFCEGWYDSWGGSTIESSYAVGKKKVITVKYTTISSI